MTETTTTFATVAEELAAAFVADTRNDGATFYKLKDDATEWLRGSSVMLGVHGALDDRLPDDWVYETASRVADTFTEYDHDDADTLREHVSEIADGLVDVYNHDRAAWLALHLGNAGLCDEAAEEYGEPKEADMFIRIGYGQYFAIERIANALIDAIDIEADTRD